MESNLTKSQDTYDHTMARHCPIVPHCPLRARAQRGKEERAQRVREKKGKKRRKRRKKEEKERKGEEKEHFYQ